MLIGIEVGEDSVADVEPSVECFIFSKACVGRIDRKECLWIAEVELHYVSVELKITVTKTAPHLVRANPHNGTYSRSTK